MEYRTIPGTDVKVSKICLGTMNYGQQCSEADAHEQLDYALANGVNFIDTAEVYPIPPEKRVQGLTETYIGTWLEKRGTRDDVVIASKVASVWQSGAMRTRDASAGFTRESVLAAIDGSLERLKTDYIDIYQLHAPQREGNYWGVRNVDELYPEDVPIEETLEALGELVKAGKIRYVGLSNETPWGLNEFLRLAREKGLPRVVTIQNQYSLMNRVFEIGLSEICLREKVGLLPYSPLDGGVLSGKYIGGVYPPGARHTLFERNRRYNAPHLQPAIEAYASVAKNHGLDMAQMALAFVNDRAFTTSNIIGATTMEQLKSDIASADLKLSTAVIADIDKVYSLYPDLHA